MQETITTIDIRKLKRQLDRVRIGAVAAIELGDCQAVAHLTCEAARLRDCIRLANSMRLELA